MGTLHLLDIVNVIVEKIDASAVIVAHALINAGVKRGLKK